jgi:hypothetical protein
MKSSLVFGFCLPFERQLEYLWNCLLPSVTMPFIILILLGLNGCLGQTAANQQTESPDWMDALRDRPSQVRDLKFIAGVPVVEGTKEIIKTIFDSDLQEIRSMKNSASSTVFRFYIEKRDRSVIVVEGLEQDRTRRNIDSVWNTMVLERESFQPLPLSSSFRSH